MSIINIIHDDREKDPWDEKYLGNGFRVATKRLKIGDYTIAGMEDLVRIEKKSSWAEISVNLSKKQYRESFITELRRLSKFPVRALVIHQEVGRIPQLSYKISHQKKIALFNWLINIPMQYGVPLFTIPAKNNSAHIVRNLLRKIYEYNKDGRLYYH